MRGRLLWGELAPRSDGARCASPCPESCAIELERARGEHDANDRPLFSNGSFGN